MTARVDPSNVKLPLSSNSPPDPAITTRLSVRSSIIAVLAVIPASTLTKPPNVVIPVILRFLPVTSSYVISPVTCKFPPTVKIPETATLPVFASTVNAVPTLTPPLAVTIPAAAILPALVIVTPVPSVTSPELTVTFPALTVTFAPKSDVELASIAPANVDTPLMYNRLLVVTPVILTPY